jgi:hypothetical protein
MTLYAGWSGGAKRLPRSWIWRDNSSILQGRLIELTTGKTYKVGARYYLEPGLAPIYLIASKPLGETASYTHTTASETSVELTGITADDCFKISEGQFTASATGWYFIGISNYNETATGSDKNSGRLVLHEVWLKEAGGGDINLLPNGDFIQKDLESGSSVFHRTTYDNQNPFHSGNSPRNEWSQTKWNLNSNQVHGALSWAEFGPTLSVTTGAKIANNAYSSLQFPKPAHP